MKFKMAATAGLSLTLDPMGIMFQNASSLKLHGQLKPNCPGIIIWWSSKKCLFFYANQKSKMATIAGHRLTLDPMGKMFKCLLLRNYKYDHHSWRPPTNSANIRSYDVYCNGTSVKVCPGVTFQPNTPKYTQIHHKIVFIVLVKGSIWIIFH
jgi:hypothetical protein